MVTEREKRALALAKKAYGHFTQDALSIAKEIIALEKEMEAETADIVVVPVTLPPATAKLPANNRSDTSTGFGSSEPGAIDPRTLRIKTPPYVATHQPEEHEIAPAVDEQRPY